ncbi:MAG: flagellar export chaperone FliS [Dermatophilus congolensis]|nr:flagellar export chaperone FliS [Dermatophilus congolensis]
MSTQAQLRNRYAREAVTTASPAQLVVMLYDRLLKDLTVAEGAIQANDIQGSHAALVHAQDILHELNATLDTSVWKEGESLKRLYEWCIEQLMQANFSKTVEGVHNAREVLEPIADAWRQVAAGMVGGN